MALFRYIGLCFLLLFLSSCKGQEEVTFLVTSDTHFGVSDSVKAYNREIISLMNELPGPPYPDSMAGRVENPRGVIITGDLTDNGSADSWNIFTSLYGLNGEKELNYPVFGGFGNHDGPVDGPVRSGIRKRNKKRKTITAVSDNGLHYSWDWNDIHLVNLNSYPSAKWDSTCSWCHYFDKSFREPQKSLPFLEKDLAKSIGQSNRPVILNFHYGFYEWGFKWWTKAERDAFYKVIQPYNILAIFYGHSHAVQMDRWRGIPVYCVGSTQKEKRAGEFMVVRITDQQMTVMERNRKGWGSIDVINRQDSLQNSRTSQNYSAHKP